MSREIVKYDNPYIITLEAYENITIEQVRKKEGEYIRNTENCVNKTINGRTHKEYIATSYKEKQSEYNRKYRETHKEERKEYDKNRMDKR